MGDELENPNADEAIAGAPDAPQDPVQAAKDEAWLAQFRVDNAAKVMEYDYQSTVDTQAQEKAAEAERDYDVHMGDKLTKDAVSSRADATADEKLAQANAARHDEYIAKAEGERHIADAADRSAGHFRDEAHIADERAKQLQGDVTEEYANFDKDRTEYQIMQEQAVAAQRIATDEAKLPHPGDAAPADPADHHQP